MLTIEILLIIISSFLAIYLLILVRPSSKKSDSVFNVDYAHRGLHDNTVPENSLAAFKRAVDMNFGIELDLQLSRDGEVMVFHDYSLERMTGRNAKLSELTADELSNLRLCGSNERIPNFREVLNLVNGRVPLLIELKGESRDISLAPKVAEILSEYKGAYCIESFNPMMVGWFAKHYPNICRGILYTNFSAGRKPSPLNLPLTLMSLNFIARPQFISYNDDYRHSFPLLICTSIYKASKFTWTIRDIESYRRAKSSGANVIFEGFIPPKS